MSDVLERMTFVPPDEDLALFEELERYGANLTQVRKGDSPRTYHLGVITISWTPRDPPADAPLMRGTDGVMEYEREPSWGWQASVPSSNGKYEIRSWSNRRTRVVADFIRTHRYGG